MDFKPLVRRHLPPLVIHREPEILEELAQHLSDIYRDGLGEGLSHEEAVARASAALPGASAEFARDLQSASRTLPALIADRWRAADDGELDGPGRRWTILADLRRDVRYALRMLLRAPGFAAVVCVTLALGIGANAVIFSAVDAVLLRQAPVADPGSVVSIYTTSSDGRDRFSSSSYPDYLDLKNSGTFADVAVFASIPLVLDAGGVTESIAGELVSGNYFDVLGVRIAQGRAFLPEEDRSGAQQRVVIVSHGAWTRRFGGDASLIGRAVSLNGTPYTVVGIAPEGFTSPVLGRAPEMWAPAALQPELRPPSAGLRRSLGHSNLLSERGPRWLNLVARLRPDSSPEAATASASMVAERLGHAYPSSNRGRQFTIVRIGEGPGVRSEVRPLLRLLFAAVVIVLLIACANVASLLLVRAVSRRREVALRMAVGAGRGRLVRQWLTESVLLSLAGAAGGVVIAVWGSPLLYRFGIPESVALGVNPRLLLFVAAVAIGSGLLFGLAPVLQTVRRDTLTAIRDEGGAVASGVRSTRLRSAFVVVQVALSLMLLVAAGLFLRTLHNATSVSLGYDIDRLLVGEVNLDVRGYSPDEGSQVYGRILERVGSLPGVEAVGAARVTVLSGAARTISVSQDGLPIAADGGNAIEVRANTISDGYLDTMRIRTIRGRGFSSTDAPGSSPVTIISQSLASRLFPGADPVGRTVRLSGDSALEIIGVVPDTIYRSSIERNAPPSLYVPLSQNYESGVNLHVRTSGNPADFIPAVREAIRQVDPRLVFNRPASMREIFVDSVGDQRMLATLVAAFGGVALLLAAVGLYGVMAHITAQRTSEIGIRLALGAPPASILGLVLGQGLRLVGTGVALGLAGAFAAVKYVENQLFGVSPTDPATFAAVCVTLLVVGAVACFVPARRAMKTNASVALRSV